MKTQESKLKDKIKSWLKERGAYSFQPVQTGYGNKSIDFLCCIPYDRVTNLVPRCTERSSRFVGIETKAPGKEPTPLQCACMKEIVAAGGAAFWCDSYDGFLRNMVVWGLIYPDSESGQWESKGLAHK